LSDGARRLLLGPVDSVDKVQLTVALHRADAPQRLDALEASAGVPTVLAHGALEQLAASGLVTEQAGGWRLAPERDLAAVSELVEGWASNRAAVLHLITHRSLERIRSSAVRAFADAFGARRRGR
jgi:hypothetical protein